MLIESFHNNTFTGCDIRRNYAFKKELEEKLNEEFSKKTPDIIDLYVDLCPHINLSTLRLCRDKPNSRITLFIPEKKFYSFAQILEFLLLNYEENFISFEHIKKTLENNPEYIQTLQDEYNKKY